MRRTSFLLAAFAALVLAFSPGPADARAGFGGSLGSRGSRTWSAPPSTGTAPYGGQTFQRSMTPGTPSYGSPGYARPGYGYSGGSSFTSGLLGGLLGAGLAGLLFGHGFFGGIGGGSGFLGFLLQIFLIVMLGRWLLRRFGGMRPNFAGAPGVFTRSPMPGPQPAPLGAVATSPPLALAPADYQAFEQTLKDVQAAWSGHDLARLRQLATPEMVSFFAEQLAEQSSRGVRNVVSDVRLLRGDLAEAWSERGRDYATVAMQFSMFDATYDDAKRLVDGSETEHVTATELWTFLRSPGGHWILSAIQQPR
ncbi:MAG: TIM44-like domain-containing protein [Acetobacteraceae bacterium]|nr:TIM44-like domain-containing protein [Acetobacteraceae bacterium]